MCRCVAAEKKNSDLPHFLGGFKAALKKILNMNIDPIQKVIISAEKFFFY